MLDVAAKAHLHTQIRRARDTLVWKLDGLSEYDVRRPLTSTGTNLLGLVKHCATSESRYLGDVFGRPFAEPVPRWEDPAAEDQDMWAAADETRADIVGLYERVWAHSDATIDALDLDSTGYVPWWQQEVPLFNVMVHVLSGTTRHAGHADILREGLDGSVGRDRGSPARHGQDESYWEARRSVIEQAALAHAADRGEDLP